MEPIPDVERDFADVWTRFHHLANASEKICKESYLPDGLLFATSLVEGLMKNVSLPELKNAQAFSDFIVEARANYREWNQHLMAMMVASGAHALNRESFAAFAADCPWLVLTDAAQDFIDSRAA